MNWLVVTNSIERGDIELLVAFWRVFSYFPKIQRNEFRSLIKQQLNYLSRLLRLPLSNTFQELVEEYDSKRINTDPNCLLKISNPKRLITYLTGATLRQHAANFELMYLVCQYWPLHLKLDRWIQEYITLYSCDILRIHSTRKSQRALTVWYFSVIGEFRERYHLVDPKDYLTEDSIIEYYKELPPALKEVFIENNYYSFESCVTTGLLNRLISSIDVYGKDTLAYCLCFNVCSLAEDIDYDKEFHHILIDSLLTNQDKNLPLVKRLLHKHGWDFDFDIEDFELQKRSAIIRQLL